MIIFASIRKIAGTDITLSTHEMQYRIIRSGELTASPWSGGTTTQLAIWPEGSSYAARDFIWRVSTARVDAEISEFTPLPGISRKLMVLDGTLLLSHDGQPEIRLGQFEQDNFTGDRHTISHGRVTDFNLMTTRGVGAIGHTQLLPGESTVYNHRPLSGDRKLLSELFYSLSDGIGVALPGMGTDTLGKGDLLTILRSPASSGGEVRLTNNSTNVAHVVRAVIRHPES